MAREAARAGGNTILAMSNNLLLLRIFGDLFHHLHKFAPERLLITLLKLIFDQLKAAETSSNSSFSAGLDTRSFSKDLALPG